MRIPVLILLLLLFTCTLFANVKADSMLQVLKTELVKKKIYDGKKESRIARLKYKLSATPKNDYSNQYIICSNLYEEYKVFQFDSAYVYTQKLAAISKITGNVAEQYESQIKVGFLLMSSGMFKETFDCLSHIDTRMLSDSAKRELFGIKSRTYSDLAEYDNDKNYSPFDRAEALTYIDSAIALSKPNSFDQLYNKGIRQVLMAELRQPSIFYAKLLSSYHLTDHQRAMVATGLSFFYNGPNQENDRIFLLTTGAINDIRSSTKETVAIFKLGQQMYLEGNIADAYLFIQEAMDNAQYYGARLRTMKIGAVLPLIAAQKIITAEKDKDRFLIYFLSISAIALVVGLISFIVFIQLKRLKAKEVIIEEKNIQLEKINDKLSEEGRIKEEYIGYFFKSISGYILKLEKIKRNVERKITTKKYEEVLATVNEINIKRERENLFYTFDHVFLKIFPNFISSFNALFKESDQIWPKDHEVLNTDLRIFALMRLGINDNEAIANILEYSVNTIYVYKMRIKAKAIVQGDQFDQKIMAIKSVDMLNKY